MAAAGEAEELVNRWALHFYFHQALRAYRAGRNRDFAELRDVMQALLVRPLPKDPDINRLLRIMQFLSRIAEGENLDCTFDRESELTPLESAIGVLDLIKRELPVTETQMESVRKMVKQAAVITCIKKREFEKATKILRKHMAKDPSSQKVRTDLLSVIREKSLSHPMIRNFSYKIFQESVLHFLEGYLDDSEPVLLEMAKENLKSKSVEEPDVLTASPASVEAPREQTASPMSMEGPKEPVASPMSMEGPKEPGANPMSLEGTNESTAACEPTEGTSEPAAAPATVELSAKHSERVKRLREETNTASDTSEASDLPARSKCLVTIHKLVMEQDSQGSSKRSGSPESCQEPVVSSASRPPVPERCTPPASPRFPRLAKSKWSPSNGEAEEPVSSEEEEAAVEEKDTWSDEEELFLNEKSGNKNTIRASATSTKKQRWTHQETEWIRKGVKKFGEGNWKVISRKFPFGNRTSVMIKDRWRTMKKLGLV
uniref:Telomeric repeat-binding factor n=1 Tax=Sphenodon punctatus TaxID=8508 RepID=A0A8D0L484_SPHPU